MGSRGQRRLGEVFLLAVLLWPCAATAQDLEPRSYINTPTDINFLIAAYGYSTGGVAFDSSVPLDNAEIEVHSQVLAFARSFGLFGNSGKFDAILPVAELSGSADLDGMPVEREVEGLADPRLRVSYNFYGAPAHTLAEHSSIPKSLLIGASLQVVAPLGQYDSIRAVNLGSNRWAFRPEIGVSKDFGKLSLELASGLALYTVNTDWFGGHRREQEPVYWVQAHSVYSITPGIWIALDAIWYGGGRTTIDGAQKDDEQGNFRLGGTVALPVTARHSIKLHASGALYTQTGTDFTTVGIAWQYRWGGGL